MSFQGKLGTQKLPALQINGSLIATGVVGILFIELA